MPAKRSSVWDWLAVGAASFTLAATIILIRTCGVQPFSLPSTSMEPSLLMGDYFFANKSAYGYSHYSLPYSPRIFSGRIFAAQPRRGDIVVFRIQRNDTLDYVKRLVGLPGDRIQMKGGVLYINGAAVRRERIADFDYASDGRTRPVAHWRETLPDGASYETLEQGRANTQEFVVPPESYFVLGDNRDNSLDSRFAEFGFIPAENLIGKVVLIFYSVGPGGAPRDERIGLRPR